MTKANAEMANRTTGALSSQAAMNAGGTVDRDLCTIDYRSANFEICRNLLQ